MRYLYAMKESWITNRIIDMISNQICNLPTGKLQYSTQRVEARVEDLCGKFAQLQPDSQKLQQVDQKTEAGFPDYKESHDDDSHQVSLESGLTLEHLK